MQRISGKNFDISIGDLTISVSKVTLTIEDKTEVAKDGGVPNGHVDGKVSGSGDMELDALAMSILTESAKAAGSWRGLEPFDMLFYAKTGQNEEMKGQATLAANLCSTACSTWTRRAAKHISKIKYLVTSPDFVRINGVPYLRPETEGLVSNEQ